MSWAYGLLPSTLFELTKLDLVPGNPSKPGICRPIAADHRQKKELKKKTTPKCLTKGSKMQTLGSTRCGSLVNLSDWNKWTTNRRLEQKCMDGEV